jgi:predicted Zn-dependent protease
LRALLATVLIALPGPAWGQRVLEFDHDFAFSAREVNTLAARAYGARLRTAVYERPAAAKLELAYLLAHEMAHVPAQHTREFVTVARYFVDNGLRRDYADIKNELSQSFPVMIRMQPIYVQQELAADYVGFVLGAQAVLRPAAMLSLLRKLGNGGRAVVATHPTEAQRLAQARDMLETCRRLYADARAHGLK